MKIKVLNIISDSNIGGAGKLLINLSENIDHGKFDLHFALPRDSRLKRHLNKYGKIYFYNSAGDRSMDIKSIPSLCKIIKCVDPDIIHTHSALNGKIAAFLCAQDKNTVFYTKHCVFDIPNYKKNRFYKMLNRTVDNMLTGKIIAVAEAAKRELVATGLNKDKITVIINGSPRLDILSEDSKNKIKKMLNISSDDFIIGISARLEKYKDHKTLIRAAAISKKNDDNMRFLILGDGAYRAELEEYSKSLQTDDRVYFLGFSENVSSYVNLFDVNVNCSIGTETSSLAISEGLSIGIPAVVSDFGGNPNMVICGKTGFVFQRENAEQLYKILFHIKNDTHMYQRMKKHAIEDYYKRFSIEKMCKKYEDIYISAVKQKKRPI